MDWYDEWWSAALGPDGFWRHEEPARHFRTALGDATDPAMTAEFVRVLLHVVDGAARGPDPAQPRDRHHPARHRHLAGMVDLGAADGSLLRAVHRLRPDWSLVGVDVRPAPAAPPGGSTWRQAVWDVRTSHWADPAGLQTAAPWDAVAAGPLLVLAHEWLDDLPCRVARRTPDGWELLGPAGPTGTPAAPEDAAWLETWAPGSRVAEVGLTRDRAWAGIARGVPAGSVLVAVDYGHQRGTRPPDGSLLGYREGRALPPVADGRTNLTAPVAVDALAAAVEAVPGVRRHLVARQSDVVAAAPARPLGPAGPLDRLVGANRRRALADPRRFGANWWLVHTTGSTS